MKFQKFNVQRFPGHFPFPLFLFIYNIIRRTPMDSVSGSKMKRTLLFYPELKRSPSPPPTPSPSPLSLPYLIQPFISIVEVKGQILK